ncbi:TlpA disulfide reductase family protein [Nereida sp. MMG025]|uniref:TlpA family protein disulfide reductase n=1 Tax=Nereida sp. MMG025 TaxID=2909981 RepID=UPI001F221EEB|nr:TlpA disulfide reductase family protein [Nereida sp. MMG025]MCF6444351.1 TlpA family protein disulfide reductase [Nereida sp. MMG025]
MRLFGLNPLYLGLGIGAIAVVGFLASQDASAPANETAQARDYSGAAGLLDGSMKKLQFRSAPTPVSSVAFTSSEGAELTLQEYAGKYTVVNFWATWCAPCRKEMPMLSELQSEFGGDDFEVVTIATGRNNPMGIKSFFKEVGVGNLPRHQDAKQALARDMAVLGLPVTIIIDPSGREIARMTGDADWASPSAKDMIKTLLAGPQDQRSADVAGN